MPRSKVGKGLTKSRASTHGNFEEGARITQGAMRLFTSGPQYNNLTAGQQEAVHMIVHKLHRIVAGNPQHKDHWDDIGGYAQLGADACSADKEHLPMFRKPTKVRKAKPRPAAKKVAARPAKKAKAKVRPAARVARNTRQRQRPAPAPAPLAEAA